MLEWKATSSSNSAIWKTIRFSRAMLRIMQLLMICVFKASRKLHTAFHGHRSEKIINKCTFLDEFPFKALQIWLNSVHLLKSSLELWDVYVGKGLNVDSTVVIPLFSCLNLRQKKLAACFTCEQVANEVRGLSRLWISVLPFHCPYLNKCL